MAEIISSPTNETPLSAQTSTIEEVPVQSPLEQEWLEDEFEEELVIEDFTIDGICGVY